MGHFSPAHWLKVNPSPLLLRLSHHNGQTWDSYTLSKENSKKTSASRDQHFFKWKSATFAILRNIDIGCILMHNF